MFQQRREVTELVTVLYKVLPRKTVCCKYKKGFSETVYRKFYLCVIKICLLHYGKSFV